MTDRELLEMAAKAANKIIVRHAEPGNKFTGLLVCGDDWAPSEVWNPLTDDGDALRLATVLYLTVGSYETYCSAGGSYAPNGYEVPSEIIVFLHETRGDRDAATRLAIVRTAAEIGKSMP